MLVKREKEAKELKITIQLYKKKEEEIKEEITVLEKNLKRNKREKKTWKQHNSCIKLTEQDLTDLEKLLHSLRKEKVQYDLHYIQLENQMKKLNKQLQLFGCDIQQSKPSQPSQKKKKEIRRKIKEKRKECVECENQLQTSQVLFQSLAHESDSCVLERVYKEIEELKQINVILNTIDKDYSVYTVFHSFIHSFIHSLKLTHSLFKTHSLLNTHSPLKTHSLTHIHDNTLENDQRKRERTV